jgi:hypothetical protein
MNTDIAQVDWRKSSRSNTEGNQCIEVALLTEPLSSAAARRTLSG